jgi:hypothetical protein
MILPDGRSHLRSGVPARREAHVTFVHPIGVSRLPPE